MLRTLALPLLLVTILVAGCDDDSSGPPYDGKAVEAGLAALFAGDHASQEDSRAGACFASELLDRSTPEELREAGVLDASYDVVTELPTLEKLLAGKWVDAQFACTDFIQESARAQAQISHGSIDREKYVACLTGALTSDQLRAAVVATLTGSFDDPEVTRLSKAQLTCARQSRVEK